MRPVRLVEAAAPELLADPSEEATAAFLAAAINWDEHAVKKQHESTARSTQMLRFPFRRPMRIFYHFMISISCHYRI